MPSPTAGAVGRTALRRGSRHSAAPSRTGASSEPSTFSGSALTDAQYGQAVAVAQYLPGPGSSQVGMAVGYQRAGWRGALASWAGFTLPSAVVMEVLGAVAVSSDIGGSRLVLGLKVVAVAVVADAIVGMARSFTTSIGTDALAVVAADRHCRAGRGRGPGRTAVHGPPGRTGQHHRRGRAPRLVAAARAGRRGA